MKKCSICGNLFTSINKNHKICSKKCRNISKNRRKKELHPKFCIDCGKERSYNSSSRCFSCKSKGFLNPMYGKKNPCKLEVKSKISQKLSGNLNPMFNVRRLGELAPTYGLIHSRESRRKMSLSHGGTGIPYQDKHDRSIFTEQLKDEIRARDNHKCRLCFRTQEENITLIGSKLDVHHIDYDKKNCNKDNLISLCKFCHSRTNFNRKYWKEYFLTTVEGSL